jgi:hypothetical protein
MVRQEKPKTDAELRKFGVVMAVPLALLAALTWWRGTWAWPYLGGAAVVFAGLGLAVPRALTLVERVWMKLALVLGAVMTRVVLVLTFFLVFAPLGLVMRALGRRPLTIGPDRGAASYWTPVEKDSAYTRADRPY